MPQSSLLIRILKRIAKNWKLIGLGVVVVGLGAYLFFGDQFAFYLQTREILDYQQVVRGPDEVMVIGYAFAPQNLEPTRFDPVTRSHIVDVYEGLVKTDRNLNIEPGVAVSWGMLDSTTWEFRLRPGIEFHNGQPVRTEDVIASIDRAVSHESSQLKDLLNTIEKVESTDRDKVRITTNAPDPLLLEKLAVVYIFPENGDSIANEPVGTGPYVFDSWENDELTLKRFEKYWGKLPSFPTVVLKTIMDRRTRVAALEDGTLDLLTNVPPSSACVEGLEHQDTCTGISRDGYIVKSIPSLEVSFLMLDSEHELFSKREVRSALSRSFDPEVFVELSFGFARPANQFVSSGVFGFNPDIVHATYDIEGAREDIGPFLGSSFERVDVTFDYPERLEPIGQYVRDQLRDLGIDVTLNALNDEELQQKILDSDTDFYFVGWRSELGDASDFLQAVAHSRDRARGYGLFNGSEYANARVDTLIEESQNELDTERRIEQLQEAMKIIVEEDVMGIPLFESETIFAYSKEIEFEPRVDGYVFANEIK